MMARLALIILLVGIFHRTNCQSASCTWTWTVPAAGSSTGTLTRSTGAPAILTVSVNDALTDGNTIKFQNDGTDITSQTYVAAENKFTPDGATYVFRYVSGGSSGNNQYTLYWTSAGVTAGDNNKPITVISQGCTAGATSPAITLDVKNCDLTYYGTAATATVTTDDCGYNCERTFTCASDSTKTFTSICQEAADWSVSDASSVCGAGVREGALLGLVILCSILSAVHLI